MTDNVLENLKLEPSEDRLTVRVALDAPLTLDAAALDRLIKALAWERARMLPEHPAKPPTEPQAYWLLDHWHLLPNIEATLPPAQAGFSLLVGSQGMGWAHLPISAAQAASMLAFLQFQPPQPPPPDRLN